MANIRKELVLAFIQKYRPATVADLKRVLSEHGIGSTDDVLLDAVHELQSDGTLSLRYPLGKSSIRSYLTDINTSFWIYTTLLAAAVEPVLVAQGPPALALLRAFLGLLLLGYLPGYATVHALFPGDQLKPLERILLSIFLSVVVSIAIGVGLGAFYQFTAITSAIGSSIYTIAACTVGSYREYSLLKTNREIGKNKP